MFAFYHNHCQVHLYRAYNILAIDGYNQVHTMTLSGSDDDNNEYQNDRIRLAATSDSNLTILFEQSYQEQLESLRARLVTLNQLNNNAEQIVNGEFFVNPKIENNTVTNETGDDIEQQQQPTEGKWQRQPSGFICYRKYDQIFQIIDVMINECPGDMRPIELFIIQSFFHGQFLYIFDHQYVYILRKRPRYPNIFQLEDIRRYGRYPMIFEQGSLFCKFKCFSNVFNIY